MFYNMNFSWKQPSSIQLKEYLVLYGSQPASNVGSHRLHYCEDIFFHFSQFLTKFTFEQICLLFWLLFKLARNRAESFPVRLTKLSLSFRSLKYLKQPFLLQSMCFHLRKLDFHIWKVLVDPRKSLTKRAASLHHIGRRIWYVDVFEFPANRESFTGMNFFLS